MAEGINLGDLSYTVTAKLDEVERQIAAFEQRFQSKVLNWTLNLDTSIAEGKLAAMESRASGLGASAIGGAYSGSTGQVASAAIQAEQVEQAAIQAESANASSLAMTGGGYGMVGGRGGRGGMRSIRALMLLHLALQGGKGVYDAVEDNQSLDDIEGRSGPAEKQAADALKVFQGEKSNFYGLPSAFRDFGNWVQGKSTSGTIEKGLKNQLDDSKVEDRIDKRTRSMRDDVSDINDQIADSEAAKGVSKALARIDSAYNKRVQKIRDDANALDDEASQIKDPGSQSQRRSSIRSARDQELSAESRLSSEERHQVIQAMHAHDAMADAISDHQRADLFGSPTDRLGADLDFIQKKRDLDLNSLNSKDPDYDRSVRRINQDANTEAAKTRRAASLDYIEHDQATADRIQELQTGTAAIQRGSKYANQFEDVQKIVDDTHRSAGEFKERGMDSRARRADTLGIEELKRMQAQITSASGNKEVDGAYTNFKDGNSDILDLLRQINTGIANLQVQFNAQ